MHKDPADLADLADKSPTRAAPCEATTTKALRFSSCEALREGSKLVEQRAADSPNAVLGFLQFKLQEQRSSTRPSVAQGLAAAKAATEEVLAT